MKDLRELWSKYVSLLPSKVPHNAYHCFFLQSLYSKYDFGSRAQANGWFKVKPDYGSSHTLDLAIVAVRVDRGGRISAFDVAALVSKDPLIFKIVGSVGATMKHLDRNRLITMLKGETGGFMDNRLPDWVQRAVMFDKNVRFINLKNITVVEVRASGLMRGTLRFPSIICIRGDKDPIDADSIKDVEEYENVRFRIGINKLI